MGSIRLRLYPANRPEEVDGAELSSADVWLVLMVALLSVERVVSETSD